MQGILGVKVVPWGGRHRHGALEVGYNVTTSPSLNISHRSLNTLSPLWVLTVVGLQREGGFDAHQSNDRLDSQKLNIKIRWCEFYHQRGVAKSNFDTDFTWSNWLVQRKKKNRAPFWVEVWIQNRHSGGLPNVIFTSVIWVLLKAVKTYVIMLPGPNIVIIFQRKWPK